MFKVTCGDCGTVVPHTFDALDFYSLPLSLQREFRGRGAAQTIALHHQFDCKVYPLEKLPYGDVRL